MIGVVLDAVLAMTLVWVAMGAMGSRNLFQAVVLFIAFGLLMSLAWLRLRAPDVAMAEAAVGAGLTGVLMLDVLGRISGSGSKRDEKVDEAD